MVAQSRDLFVRTACGGSTVSVPARTTPMNIRIDDTRCFATTNVPRLRTDTASAKLEKRRSGKVRTVDLRLGLHCDDRTPRRSKSGLSPPQPNAAQWSIGRCAESRDCKVSVAGRSGKVGSAQNRHLSVHHIAATQPVEADVDLEPANDHTYLGHLRWDRSNIASRRSC